MLVRPNVLLVVFDTCRADALEPYGAPVGSTPTVADLGRRGRVIEGAYSTANWTLPSHASMLTGRLPRALGLNGAQGARAALTGARDRSLPHVLRGSGYETAGVSANLWITERHGFATGFERFEEVVGTRPHRPPDSLRGRLRWLVESVLARIDDGLLEAEDVVRRWISESGERPSFWFVNLMECHSPYLPPKPYNDLPPSRRLRAGWEAAKYQSHRGFTEVCTGSLHPSAAAYDRMRYLYQRAVRSMDDWLARVLEAMEARGILDDTLVIVTSDHGENLGEQHLLGHAFSLDDRLIRVPLVLSGPGVSEGAEGLVSLASLPRMVAEAVGLEGHPWADPTAPDAVVAQSDGFALGREDAAESVVRSWGLPREAVDLLLTSRSCATDGRFKLVRTVGGPDELFDLSRDPLETQDVSSAHPDAVDRLRAHIERADAEVAPAGGAGDDVDEGEAELADLEDRMRLLGYL